MMMNREQLIDVPERRSIPVQNFEFRKRGDTLEFSGYATVFDHPYEVLGGPPLGWIEDVDPGSVDVTLASDPDVHLLVNHEGLPLARTKSKTLTLSKDGRGLKTFSPLDRRDPDVQRLEVKMDRGDLDEMSMAFRTKRHSWNEDKTERRLLEISLHKGDVSIVNFGANPATSAQLRSMLEFLEDLDTGDALVELRSVDDPLVRLRAARDTLDRLIREATPAEKRTLSLVTARKILAGT